MGGIKGNLTPTACIFRHRWRTICHMRIVFALLLAIVLLNLGARCPTPAATPPQGCERIGTAGLLHCANPVEPSAD